MAAQSPSGLTAILYVALAMAAAANDPLKNGQNLNTILGKILRLRIDVDRREEKSSLCDSG